MNRNLLLAIIAIILVVITVQPVYAGFATAKKTTAALPVAPADAKQTICGKKHELIATIKSQVKSIFFFDYQEERKHKKAGWQNIASLCCATLGFFSIFMAFAGIISAQGWSALAVAAIIFGLLCGIGGIVLGIMGIKKKQRFRGFALAGVILGCFDVFFLSVVAVFAAALS